MHLYSKIIFALLFFIAYTGSAQTLIPWLGANGKYGYADETGKVVVPPEFDQAPIMPADSFGVAVAKARIPWYLLRNGMLLPGKNAGSTFLVDYGEDEQGVPDTIKHLWLAHVGGKAFFIDHLARDTQQYWPYQNYNSPIWFSKYYRKEDNEVAFQYGFCRVYKGRSKVNFLNTHLKEVFSHDLPAGVALNRQFVLLGDKHQKMAIGDSSGRIRTPFVWDALWRSGREGFFLANNPGHPTRHARWERAGLIDADGKIVIDTVYRDVEVAGKDYIIVRKKNRAAGVMDYSGKWVIPMEYGEITHVHGDFFIAEIPQGKVNVINTKGEKQFPVDYNAIVLQKGDRGQKIWLELWEYPVVSMADTGFQVLFSDTNAQSLFVRHLTSDKNQFITRKDVPKKPNGRHGVRDHTGKIIIPMEYDMLGLMAGQTDLYLVEKDDLYGLFDTDGKVVLPVQYASIRPDQADGYEKIGMVWARPAGSKMFSAYDLKGKKLPYPDNFMPSRDPDLLVEEVYNKKDKTAELVLIDGSRTILKDHYKYLDMKQFRTPDGGFLINVSDGNRVLGATLKNILPAGFILPKSLFDSTRIKKTGLLTVYQPAPGFAEPEETDEPLQMLATPHLPEGITSSGVINAKGEWVVGPKKGVHFLPMSHHWVLEIGKTDGSAGQNFKVYRVNHPKREIFDLDRVRFTIFDDRNNYNMLFQVSAPRERRSDSHTLRYAYFNNKGEQLTGFHFLNGGMYLRKRNIVSTQKPNGEVTDLIVDEKGQVIVDLGANLDAAALFGEPGAWNGDFLVASRRDDGQYGLLDSTGKTVLPFQYKYLQILAPGQLLSCNNAEGNPNLLDWQGNLIFTFPKSAYAKYFFKSKNGHILVTTEDLTVVITPEGKLLRSFPGKVVEVSTLAECPQLAAVYDPVLKQSYWMDFISGRVYRE